jgi:hypothetical protein
MSIKNEWGEKFRAPHKTKSQEEKLKSNVDDFDNCVIRIMFLEFRTTEDNRPTLKSLVAVVKEKLNSVAVSGLFGK